MIIIIKQFKRILKHILFCDKDMWDCMKIKAILLCLFIAYDNGFELTNKGIIKVMAIKDVEQNIIIFKVKKKLLEMKE